MKARLTALYLFSLLVAGGEMVGGFFLFAIRVVLVGFAI